jgi:hypothetical protein
MLKAIDIAWAAGFLEGEGSFTCRGNTVTVTASQVQPEPVYRLQRLFGGKLYHYTQANPKHSPFIRWHLFHRDARGLMMTIYPLMSPKRRQQIVKALARWKSTGVAMRLRTHCPRGHPYSSENTAINKTSGRQCRICARGWIDAWYRRKKGLRLVNDPRQVDLTED